jgi:hypothetical protein
MGEQPKAPVAVHRTDNQGTRGIGWAVTLGLGSHSRESGGILCLLRETNRHLKGAQSTCSLPTLSCQAPTSRTGFLCVRFHPWLPDDTCLFRFSSRNAGNKTSHACKPLSEPVPTPPLAPGLPETHARIAGIYIPLYLAALCAACSSVVRTSAWARFRWLLESVPDQT